MNQRITEHKRALSSLDFNMSAVAEHAIKTDHNIGWEDFEIWDSQQELYKRCYLESWHIVMYVGYESGTVLKSAS